MVQISVTRGDHEGLRDLARVLVRHADDGAVGHVGMVDQDRLELSRRDLEALVLDELLQPVDDE